MAQIFFNMLSNIWVYSEIAPFISLKFVAGVELTWISNYPISTSKSTHQCEFMVSNNLEKIISVLYQFFITYIHSDMFVWICMMGGFYSKLMDIFCRWNEKIEMDSYCRKKKRIKEKNFVFLRREFFFWQNGKAEKIEK